MAFQTVPAGAAPAGASKQQQREAQIKVMRANKAERIQLEAERKKLRSARIRRKTRAKYDAKLKQLKAQAIEEGAADAPSGTAGTGGGVTTSQKRSE